MKAIILAAGRGTRLKPITDTTPKPLIKIREKSIIEYFLEQIYSHVTEIIIVVNYKHEMFEKTFGESYCGTPITYHLQGEKKWTGGALEWIVCSEDVFIFYADAIFEDKDIKKVIHHDGYGCLVQRVQNPEKYGIFHQKENGTAIKVVEKPKEYIWDLANLWVYKFSCKILDLIKKLQPSPRGEYELTDAINEFCTTNNLQLFPIEWFFLDISFPEDIKTSEEALEKITQSILQERPAFWVSKKLTSLKNFQLHLGIKKEHIAKLIEYSQDESDIPLQKNTGDKKRFSEVSKIESWYNDNWRYLFTLVSNEWELAGIWWWRPCKLPEISEVIDTSIYNYVIQNSDTLHTNWIRIYPKFRGQRIATPFVNTASMFYKDIFSNFIMSVDVHEDNIPMQKWFERAGYAKLWYGKNINSSNNTGEKRYIYIQKN